MRKTIVLLGLLLGSGYLAVACGSEDDSGTTGTGGKDGGAGTGGTSGGGGSGNTCLLYTSDAADE